MSEVGTVSVSNMLRMLVPRQPTFWTTLSQEERNGAIQQNSSRKFGDEMAWNPAGCVEDKWNTEVKSKVGCVLQDNESRIFKGLRIKKSYAFHCWMVGTTMNNCLPTVVVFSTMAKVARQAAEVINKSRVLEDFGFCCRWFKATIKQPAGDSEVSQEQQGLCGASIIISKNISETVASARRATMGGIVSINAINYGLTVAHTLLPDELELDDELELEDELELDDQPQAHSSLGHMAYDRTGSSPVANDVRIYLAASAQTTTDHGLIGPVSRTGKPDWALVEIQNTNIRISNSILLPDSGTLYPCRATSEAVSRDVWVAAGSSGVRKAFLSGSTCGLYLPGLGLQDVFALDLRIGDYSFGSKLLAILTN